MLECYFKDYLCCRCILSWKYAQHCSRMVRTILMRPDQGTLVTTIKRYIAINNQRMAGLGKEWGVGRVPARRGEAATRRTALQDSRGGRG